MARPHDVFRKAEKKLHGKLSHEEIAKKLASKPENIAAAMYSNNNPLFKTIKATRMVNRDAKK